MNEYQAVDNKKNRRFICIATTIIILLSSVLLYSKVIKPKKYEEYFTLGNKYLTEEKYNEAILQFEKAIKINSRSTEAIIGLSKGYIGINDINSAIDKLEYAQNMDKTNENLLKDILDILIKVDSEIAYKFLEVFVSEVGETNISKYVKSLLNESKEFPKEINLSIEPGKYAKPISIKLNLDNMKIGHSYYYTLDGTDPNKTSTKYLGKIDIKQSTTIKLIGYNKKNESTNIATFEYIIDKAIIDELSGIITEGENLIKNTTIGTEIGNISKEDKEELKLLISQSKDLLNKEVLSYEQISNMIYKMENGINNFKNNIIKPIDKSKLKISISEAETLYKNAIEGSSNGQYKVGSKDDLLKSINDAKLIYDKAIKQNNIDEANNKLQNAINKFKKSKVSTMISKEEAVRIIRSEGGSFATEEIFYVEDSVTLKSGRKYNEYYSIMFMSGERFAVHKYKGTVHYVTPAGDAIMSLH